MTFKRTTKFPGFWLPEDADRPQGNAKSSTTPTSKDGSPWARLLINDYEGYFQGLLFRAGIIPSGNPDTVLVSDFHDSLDIIIADQRRLKTELVVNIPADFATLQAAVDFHSGKTAFGDKLIRLVIKDGHLLTAGLGCFNGDYSQFRIEAELGNTVLLDAGFVGVDTSSVPAGVLGETPRAPLFFGFNSVMPWIDALFDMAGLFGTGYQLARATGFVGEAKGVINAGFRGAQIHGECNMYAANFSGAKGSGLRLQQAAKVNARNGVFDNCCSTEDLTNSAVYASRSSAFEFRGGSAQNSGASGLIARRSLVTADDANFDGAALKGIDAETEAKVSFVGGSAIDCVSSSVSAVFGAEIHAGSATLSTTTSADNISVDEGGVVYTNAGTVTEGGSTEADILANCTETMLNVFTDSGMVFYNNGNGTFKVTTNSNGIAIRHADGRLQMISSFIVDTGSIAVGAFSGQLTLPALPDVPITEDSTVLTVVGRTSIGGGGNRVAVDSYHRGLSTGSEWKIRNTGVQLDGVSTILVVESINVQRIVWGTWR